MNSVRQNKDHLNYRPDIDGLRAVAVLLVLAFHLGINRVGGGYVGVDVFFVISGFLISSVILQQLGKSQFSLVSFYERRIRRIFPALVVVLFASIWPAYKFMLPSEMVDYAKSFLAATFSFSNFYFLSQSGYFDAPASAKPLLHTWSLAVEEQFYLFLPLFLMSIRRVAPRLQSGLVVVMAVASLVASIFGAYHNHDATFTCCTHAHGNSCLEPCWQWISSQSSPARFGEIFFHLLA
jgi:peptidoglycan/LPS O-acetylase OafA/YrhL